MLAATIQPVEVNMDIETLRAKKAKFEDAIINVVNDSLKEWNDNCDYPISSIDISFIETTMLDSTRSYTVGNISANVDTGL